MRTIDFLKLPVAAREAFAQAINDHRALLAKPAASGVYVVPAIAGAFLLVAVGAWGFGGQDQDLTSQSPLMIATYALGIGGLVVAALLFRRERALRRLLGCAPGVYAVGSQMIDARSRSLRVYDLCSSRPMIDHQVSGASRGSSVVWHGFRFTFPLGNMPERVVASLHAQPPDPIAAAVASIGKAATAPLASSRFPLELVAIVSMGLALPTWYARNCASLEIAFHEIRSSHDLDIWVRDGGSPARAAGKRMELDLEEVVLVDADHADKLRDALARYPEAPDELTKPVEVALATRYEDARRHAHALSSSGPLRAFIDQVYDRLEAHGVAAVMQVDVARTDISALTTLDDQIAAYPWRRRFAPVAKYFDPARDASRTAALRAAVQNGLAQFFPSDIMVFRDEASADEAKITIFYVIRPSIASDGDIVIYQTVDANHEPVPGALEYPGVEFELGATLEVPGGATPQRATFTAHPAPSLKTESLDASSVYGAMADSAFADLQLELVHALGGWPDLDESLDVPR